jgi:hypothetical protein
MEPGTVVPICRATISNPNVFIVASALRALKGPSGRAGHVPHAVEWQTATLT